MSLDRLTDITLPGHAESAPTGASRVADGAGDLYAGFIRSWLWTKLAYQDIKLRYRGSILGPFWVTLTNLLLIAAIGTIYSTVFQIDAADYVPYVASGLLVWQFISGVINDAPVTFIAAQEIIQQIPLPFSLHVFRTVYRNQLLLAHNAIIIPFIFIIYHMNIGWRLLQIIPALLILSINGVSISLFLGTASARFRDIPPIVGSVMQIAFFLTPIFWPISTAAHLKRFLVLNPFFSAIDVVRAPLLNTATEPSSWPLLLGCTALGCIGGFGFFARFRGRIAYWI